MIGCNDETVLAIARATARDVGWALAATEEKQIAIVLRVITMLRENGVELAITGPLEVNAPAMLMTQIDQAREALAEDAEGKIDIAEARHILDEAGDLVDMLIDWFRELQKIGVRVPITWTNFVHHQEHPEGK